jgi:pimeloyl-ACP methyl ester carboxylesterase
VSGPVADRGLYLPSGAVDSSFGFFHAPAPADGDGPAVLICPPFGWEDLCSFRSRRSWAKDLAAHGFPALRIDLPSSGDAPGSPSDPGRVEAWTEAVVAGGLWLREKTARERIAVVGIGLGGFIAVNAVAGGAEIDDLVLWAVPARGDTVVRELRVFARLNAVEVDPADATGQPGHPEPEPLPDGALEVGGFLLGPETVGALNSLDLTALELPRRPGRRALLLGRDGINPDPDLVALFERHGAAVSVGPGAGFTEMMNHPQLAQAPTAQFDSVRSWLAQGPSTPVGGVGSSAGSRDQCAISIGGARIRERVFTVEQPFGRVVGVLAEPLDAEEAPLSAVLLNAGALRRIGPGRIWVDTARRWAAMGFPALRVDLQGIGDADGETTAYADTADFYTLELVDQVVAVLDRMEDANLPSAFALMGLCSGAYWAFHTALRDARVEAALLLNPRALFWDDSIEADYAAQKVAHLRRPGSWSRVIRGEVSSARMREIVGAKIRATSRRRSAARAERGRLLDQALDRLGEADQRLLLAFGSDEPLYNEIERSGQLESIARRANVELERLPGDDHTLRPISTQRYVAKLLDRTMEREYAGSSGHD